MLCLHDAKHWRSIEQFIHHLNVSSHADISYQVVGKDRDFVLLSRSI